jgi:putative transposase
MLDSLDKHKNHDEDKPVTRELERLLNETRTKVMMAVTVRKSYKYRIYPTKIQLKQFEFTLDTCCDLYNAAYLERKYTYQMYKYGGRLRGEEKAPSVNHASQCKALTALKEDFPHFKEVYSQVLQDVLRRVDKTFDNFFTRLSAEDKPGFPRYKTYNRYNSFTYPQNGWALHNNTLSLSKISGSIKVRLHRKATGKVKTCSIVRDGSHWYVVFSVETEIESAINTGEPVGIDVGLEHFANLSNGVQVENPRFFRNSEKRLAKAQRKFARLNHLPRTEPKKLKAKQAVQKAYRKVRNQRADFHHKLSRSLVTQHSLIIVEDLNVKGMAKGMLSKSVNDAGWSSFIRMLEYKAAEAGSQVIKVDLRYTSQECPSCGEKKKKTLGVRWHSCECGYSGQRDIASAKIILSRGLATLGGNTLDTVA